MTLSVLSRLSTISYLKYNPEVIPGGLYILLPISMFGWDSAIGNIPSLIGSGPLLLDDGQVYGTGNNPYGQISQNEEVQFQDNLKKAIIHHGI
ncbi:MAG: RCC1 domain-containing protein [Nitrososphaeraceae archaeon]